jgi:hypothetical protein
VVYINFIDVINQRKRFAFEVRRKYSHLLALLYIPWIPYSASQWTATPAIYTTVALHDSPVAKNVYVLTEQVRKYRHIFQTIHIFSHPSISMRIQKEVLHLTSITALAHAICHQHKMLIPDHLESLRWRAHHKLKNNYSPTLTDSGLTYFANYLPALTHIYKKTNNITYARTIQLTTLRSCLEWLIRLFRACLVCRD